MKSIQSGSLTTIKWAGIFFDKFGTNGCYSCKITNFIFILFLKIFPNTFIFPSNWSIFLGNFTSTDTSLKLIFFFEKKHLKMKKRKQWKNKLFNNTWKFNNIYTVKNVLFHTYILMYWKRTWKIHSSLNIKFKKKKELRRTNNLLIVSC